MRTLNTLFACLIFAAGFTSSSLHAQPATADTDDVSTMGAHDACHRGPSEGQGTLSEMLRSAPDWVKASGPYLAAVPLFEGDADCGVRSATMTVDCELVIEGSVVGLAHACETNAGQHIILNGAVVQPDSLAPLDPSSYDGNLRVDHSATSGGMNLDITVPKSTSQSNSDACSAHFTGHDAYGNGPSSDTATCRKFFPAVNSSEAAVTAREQIAIDYCNTTGNMRPRLWFGNESSSGYTLSAGQVYECMM